MMQKKKKQPLLLHNTLTNTKEEFIPKNPKNVRMYNCGPTAYDFQHIGNLSNAVFVDVLRRTLKYNNFDVQQVINITDFGHLTSDADEGDDKMSIGLAREGLEVTLENMAKLAEKYTEAYLSDITLLGLPTADIEFPRASAYVDAQIALIKTLEEKGYAYVTDSGVYFDTERFANYGALGGQSDTLQKEGARVAVNTEKRDPKDFVLWKLDTDLGWKSPWGKGFPGWHIECSAMIYSTLGKQIDIHTGGIEHIGVHHNNEIAQSEAATGRSPLSRFWLHRAHILLEGRKISKSIGNTVYLRQIVDRGFSPLSFRYWLLTAHYRTPANFTWEALEGSHTALKKLHRYFVDELSVPTGATDEAYQERFQSFIHDDLDTAKAIALVWELVHDESITKESKRATLLNFDTVLGLGLNESDTDLTTLLRGEAQKLTVSDIPKDIQKLVEQREKARIGKDFETADSLRGEISIAGYEIDDTDTGPVLTSL
ncbi:cysteine--tRNA ligase [Candidatus Kaiserbacteria bacterium]|nr:MAG: cysteine--tRNA ligase [Candidatus Kaiserbacteria bacterium]